MRSSNLTAQRIDEVLAGTFPASDPPAWTPGIARLAPAIAKRPAESDISEPDSNRLRGDVIDVSRSGSERTFAQAIASWIGTAALAMLVGLAIVAVGTVLTLGVRGVVATAEWVLAMIW